MTMTNHDPARPGLAVGAGRGHGGVRVRAGLGLLSFQTWLTVELN